MNLNCQSCDALLKKERGCYEKGAVPFYIGNEKHFKCPIRIVSSTSWKYIKAYGLYKRNFLPNGNAWLNESDKFLNAMSIIASEAAKIENSKTKKRGKKRGRPRS